MNGGGTGSKQATSVGDTSNAEEFEIEADVTQPDIMVSKSMVSTEHRCTLCKASKTSLQLNGHHKSKQKCDLLCSVLHATEK